ncbi:hypothetical protein DV737_g1673, partial [Chaetothyriales sp. CBS 132003]
MCCSYVPYEEKSQPGLPTPTDDSPEDKRDATPCPSWSEDAEHWQRTSAVANQNALNSSNPLKRRAPAKTLEQLQERMGELESYVKAAGSTPVLGEKFPGMYQCGGGLAAPRHEDGLRDFERSLLRGRSFKTQYFGPSHAASLLLQFEELSTFVRDILKRPPGFVKFKDHFKESRKMLRFASDVDEEITFERLVAMVPSRERADAFVGQYYETYETTYRVLHTPSFTREYEQFWSERGSAREWFVVQLLLVCASVNWAVAGDTDAFVGRSSVNREKATRWIKAAESWIERQSHKHTPLEYYQTHILLFIAKRNICYKVKREWTVAGTLLRLAMAAGFHREPTLLSHKISVFDQEMRRRLWYTVVELEVQASCTRGMRAAISADDWDCLAPLNIHDEDFNETTQVMPSALPLTTFTRTSFLVSAASHVALRLEMLNAINSLSSRISIKPAMNYDGLTRAALDALPRYTSTPAKPTTFPSVASKLLLHEFLLLLHQPFATSTLSESRYFYSRCARRDSALTILRIYTWPKLPLSQRLILSSSQDANLRACLATCHDIVVASYRLGACAADMTHDRGLSVDYIRDSVELFGTRVKRLGQGFHSYWITSSALGLVQSRINADEPAEKFAEEAAKRVMILHDEIIAVQRPGYDGLASSQDLQADTAKQGLQQQQQHEAAGETNGAAPSGSGQQADGERGAPGGGVEAGGMGTGLNASYEMDGFATDGGDDLIAKLKAADPSELERRQQALNERIDATFRRSQQRLADLIDENSTLPTTVSSVTVLGAPNTRHGFLKRIVEPLLSANRDRPYTHSEVVQEVAATADKLRQFAIFQEPISIYLDKPSQTDALTTPTDIAVFYSVKERGRVTLKTGTDVGNAEGSGYVNAQWRNMFGGAETLDANASLGTKTRSSYSAFFDTPILSNAQYGFQVGGVQSATQKTFASHEESLRGGWAKLRWLSAANSSHELAYNGFWRQITGLGQNASPTVRNDAGDSVKSSISHLWIKDGRDSPLLPQSGYYLKTVAELAGVGPLQGDVAFVKGEVEQQTTIPIPIPGISGKSGVSFSAGLRAGLLYPLALGSSSTVKGSRINDRFQLGGPNDIRGFRLSGVGPHDGSDAVGGDVYAAGSANLLVPLPKLGADKPLRLHAFVNGGRLLALRHDKEGPLTKEEVKKSVADTIAELGNGLPSTSAGIGLVYAHAVARFELNFSLPLVVRKGEDARKGLQFGIGINFL